MRILLISLTLVLSLGLGQVSAQPGHVILISIDGLAAYHLENRALDLPNIKELISQGVWAESSETVFPSVTHPSHTSMITGVPPRLHGVIGNRLKNRLTGEEYHITNKPRSESIRVPTIFDVAKEAGLRTASFFWPETKDDPSIDYNIPEVFNPEGKADIRAVRDSFLQNLRDRGVPIDLYYRLYGRALLQGAADTVMAEAAAHVIRTARPQLLALHILVTDNVQHRYGDSHYMSKSALTMADTCVGILRRAVREAGLEGSTTYVIAADHGFQSVYHEMNLYPLFEEAGIQDRVSLHPSYWTLFVELTEKFNRQRDQSVLDRLLEKARSLDGISTVVPPENFHRLGYPRYEEDPHVPGQYMIIADIDTFLVSDPAGTSTARARKRSPSHGHGYLPSHPRMYPGFVISGHKIRRGKRIGHIHNFDIAPTIANLLDLDMKGLNGRVLTEALLMPDRIFK